MKPRASKGEGMTLNIKLDGMATRGKDYKIAAVSE